MKGRRKLPSTTLGRLDLMPPFLAWALARIGRGGNMRRPTPHEAAAKAKMSLRTFNRVASKLSWASVKAGEIDGFLAACNVDPHRLKQQRDYIKWRAKFGTLRLLNHVQQVQFEKRLAEWSKLRELRKNAIAADTL